MNGDDILVIVGLVIGILIWIALRWREQGETITTSVGRIRNGKWE